LGAMNSGRTEGSHSSAASAHTEDHSCDAAAAAVPSEQQSACGTLSESTLESVLDVTSNSTAGLDHICSDSCQNFLQSLPKRYPQCYPSETVSAFKFIGAMCQKQNGQYCAVTMKSVTKIDCSDYSTQSTCNTAAGKDCAWKSQTTSYGYTTGTCQASPTTSTLTQICSPCLHRFVLLLGEMESGDQSTYLNYMTVMCAKQGDTFCYPLFSNLDDRIWSISADNTMSLDAIKSNVSSICATSEARRCLATVGSATVAQQRLNNNKEYASCIKYSGSSYGSSCVQNWLSGDRKAAAIAGDVNMFCSANDNSTLCLPLAHATVRSTAIVRLNYGYTCTSEYAANLTASIATLGCCINVLNRDQNTDFDPNQLPNGTKGLPTGTSVPNVTLPSWSTNPFRTWIARCSSVAGFNSTVQIAAANASCIGMTASPPRREVRLLGVLWASVNSNWGLKTNLQAGCVSDMSSAIGCSPSAINCSVVEDTSQSLSTSSSSRRAGGQSGTKFQFTISGQNNADATANAQAFDTLQANNALTVPTTATTIQTDCSNCLAAGTSSSNLFSGLTGGQTSVTSSPSSSANAVSVALATVLAVIVVALL